MSAATKPAHERYTDTATPPSAAGVIRLVPGGANFSLFSTARLRMDLLLFDHETTAGPRGHPPSIPSSTGLITIGTFRARYQSGQIYGYRILRPVRSLERPPLRSHRSSFSTLTAAPSPFRLPPTIGRLRLRTGDNARLP